MWRAVDSEREMLDVLVQSRRDKVAEALEEITSETGLCPDRHCDRQTRILRRRAPRYWFLGSPRPRASIQQLSGKFASTRSTT
jgi:hypothetical protein